jgi:ABC-2 type transport system ATP-binding protein
MTAAISVSHLTKRYGAKAVVDDVSFDIPAGHIVGLIGANGSGKTTTLKALLGLIPSQGDISVLGHDPRVSRDEMMKDVCFIADVAVLPRWITAGQALDFTAGVHPRFNRARADAYLAKTSIRPDMKVRQMSKGMVTQLHLSLVMAIDAKVLVLDEPTLGLDLLYRKQFYQNLIEDYFDDNKTILITTHQVEEVEHLLTDLIFIQNGKLALSCPVEDAQSRFTQVLVRTPHLEAARALGPIAERQVFGQSVMVFDGVPRAQLEAFGDAACVSIADLFVSTMKGTYA